MARKTFTSQTFNTRGYDAVDLGGGVDLGAQMLAWRDEETVWALHNRAVAQACKRNLGTVDGFLTKAEAQAKAGSKVPR